MKKVHIGTLIFALLLPLVVGGISAFITMDGMKIYKTMNKPALSPPSWVFMVAWTILYIVMGLASYFIMISKENTRLKIIALALYIIQLAMNFMWSIIFFNWGMYFFAFAWLLAMWCLVIACAFRFYGISKLAAYMFIPYILWLTFAAYLNFGAYILN